MTCTYLGGRRAGGGGPVRERPDLRNTCPLRRFQAQKDPKKVRIWEVGGRGGVRSGNGPTSEIRALYGVFRGGSGPNGPTSEIRALYGGFRPKKTQKRYVFGRLAGGGGGGVRSIRALYGVFRPKKTQKRYVFGRSAGGGGGGPVRERPDLRNTCPLRRFQAQKDPNRVRIWEVGGRGGVRSGNGPTSEIRALCGVFRPKKTLKGYVFGRSVGGGGSGPGTARPTYLGGRRAGGGGGPMARPPKYVPFTAFPGPKRPKKRSAGGV